MPITKALLKYGYSNFKLEILEYCEVENVLAREQYYLDTNKPEYNILKVAGNSAGFVHSEESKGLMRGRKLSEESKAKMRKSSKERFERERKIGQINKHSEDTIAKIRAFRLGRNHSEETRNKIGVALGTIVKVTDQETGITNIYYSKTQAAKELSTSLDTVRRYIISGKPFKGKYLIEIIPGEASSEN